MSMTAVAYYTTPYEVVTKIRLVPAALVGVLFPAFASSFATNANRTERMFRTGVKCLFLVLFPITLVTVTFAREGLTLWLGSEFARNSARVVQWLAVGVFLNSLAQVPFALIQGVGRPDLTAKLHLFELPLYVVALWLLVGRYGILGAAVAWVLRAAVDTLCLFAIALWVLPSDLQRIRRMALVLGLALVMLATGAAPVTARVKGLLVSLTLIGFACAGWFIFLSSEERALVRSSVKTINTVRI
jgi:O-antigen/teichoic acid export membrane protein